MRESAPPRSAHAGRPFTLSHRRVGAVALTFLMLASSGAFVAAGALAAPASSTHTPLASASVLAGVVPGPKLAAGPFTTQPGTPVSTTPNATVVGPVAPTMPTLFTIGFQMRNSEELAQLLQAQSTPGSPMFHQWLTVDQERTMFGADPVAYQNTINYFTSLGFKVQTEGLLSVSFSGSAAQVATAFHTQLSNVAYGNGQTASMNSEPLSLPASIATEVSSVNGFDGAQVAQPTSYVNPQVLQDMQGSSPIVVPAGAPLPSQLSGAASPVGNLSTIFNVSHQGFFWVYYYSHSHHRYISFQVVTPGALNALYNGSQLIDQGINGDSTGSPITIAIIMAGGINPTDMQGWGDLAWNNPNQITNRLTPTPVDGAFTDNGTVYWTDGASSEMALDIEFSSTMAPGAHIMPVYGPCLCTNVLDDDYALLSTMAKVPNIISNSWGGSEDRWPSLYGPNWANALTMHDYFMLLTGRGSTVLASSGDGGGFDTGTGMLSGSFPATDPYVLAVNGLRTSVTDASGSPFPSQTSYGIVNISIGVNPQSPIFFNYPVHAGQVTRLLSQTYWYEPYSNYTLYNSPPQGSGGFDTSYWFNQTWMEHGYGIPDLGRSLGSGVAAEADYNQSIYFDGSMQFFWGGTSFACPTTAGMFALVEDYLAHSGHNPYLGNGNGVVYDVWNAWSNGNLTLKPFYDIASPNGGNANGTSFWGNFGVQQGYEFPPGQKFPYSHGSTTYGNTTPGWDFPTGFGSVIVDNFAEDLAALESMPGTFMTTNAAGTAYDYGAWAYMVLNHTYSIHVNLTSALQLSGPHVTVVFHGADGTNTSMQPTLTSTGLPSTGMTFALDTGTAPYSQPGFVVFELGNSTSNSIGFSYDWISYPAPTGGTLNVTVVAPSSSQILSGYPQFNPWPFGYFAPVMVDPNCCTSVPNTFTVHVTLNGAGVYNAAVTAQIPSLSVLAWQGSRIQSATQSLGNPHEQSSTTLSFSYTNETGYAVVYTWNLVAPTPYFVNASFGAATGGTVFQLSPGPNVKTTDVAGGKYSQFNTVDYVLTNLRQPVNPTTEDLWAPNSNNQTGYYNLLYGWQGEVLPVSTNDYAGHAMPGTHVWLGTLDTGGENRFYSYQPSFGVVGVTNTSGTSNITDPTGNATIFIPDNMTDNNFFTYPNGQTAGFGYVAASMAGQSNRTFSYTEPCPPTLPNPASLITCQFNDTYQRNYTAVPILILQDPVNVTTQTSSGTARDFFSSGGNISWRVNVLLPGNDPFVNGYGFDWLPGVEHVVSVKAYVDGQFAGDLSPASYSQWQNYTATGNLTGNYGPGIHDLRVVATDSVGHTFTRDHTFVIGAIDITDLSIQNTYTVLPFNLTWSYVIPPSEMNNHSFSQSLQIRYVAPGCGTSFPCPVVVNYTIKVRDGVVDYNQSLNLTLLSLDNFYSGATSLPPGQYQIIVWLNANHSGSIASQVNTELVFDPVKGQINGPGSGDVVPLGNVTISYAYSGQYIQNATLAVFPVGSTTPVYTAYAFVPGLSGLRGGAAQWTAVTPGAYEIVLELGTPYGHDNVTSNITVAVTAGQVYLNQSHASNVVGGGNPAIVGTILVIVGAILGLLVGLFLAPGLRGGSGSRGPLRPSAAGGAAAAPAPWSEETSKGGGGKQRCSVCQEQFETEFALHQHLKISHGIEE